MNVLARGEDRFDEAIQRRAVAGDFGFKFQSLAHGHVCAGEAELRGEGRAFLPINGATIPGRCVTKARPFIPSGFDPDGLAADEVEPVKARGIVRSHAQSRVRSDCPHRSGVRKSSTSFSFSALW